MFNNISIARKLALGLGSIVAVILVLLALAYTAFARLAEVPNAPPRKGERWRFNAYRLEHVERRQVEGQSFSPLFVGDFHALPRFGWLVFE